MVKVHQSALPLLALRSVTALDVGAYVDEKLANYTHDRRLTSTSQHLDFDCTGGGDYLVHFEYSSRSYKRWECGLQKYGASYNSVQRETYRLPCDWHTCYIDGTLGASYSWYDVLVESTGTSNQAVAALPWRVGTGVMRLDERYIDREHHSVMMRKEWYGMDVSATANSVDLDAGEVKRLMAFTGGYETFTPATGDQWDSDFSLMPPDRRGLLFLTMIVAFVVEEACEFIVAELAEGMVVERMGGVLREFEAGTVEVTEPGLGFMRIRVSEETADDAEFSFEASHNGADNDQIMTVRVAHETPVLSVPRGDNLGLSMEYTFGEPNTLPYRSMQTVRVGTDDKAFAGFQRANWAGEYHAHAA